MLEKGCQKNATRQNSYSFTQMMTNIHIFIIQHKNSKLKLPAGGTQGVIEPKIVKKMKKKMLSKKIKK